MSVENPTAKQLEALRRVHRSNIGTRKVHKMGQVTHTEVVTFCVECQQVVPCRTMKALGAKK